MRAALFLLLLLLPAAGADAGVTCRAKPLRDGYWSWREIDGRRCWYLGRPGMSKTLLHWVGDAPPSEEPREAVVVDTPQPTDLSGTFIDRWDTTAPSLYDKQPITDRRPWND